ncbi:PMS1 protein homolog 1 isoform X2 [Bombina bombina]|uniref:PMS1 protein homolog 1 isoform X2 n=1 Tax=Bombina bombina TaxID=8345 RepID=UPI00235B09E0|nr:PMS1 protein homolog 1 isoform X2 [Bombina bombina]
MHHLPPATIRLLSSSQVITSVVSVVKELLENALDADATNIDVKLDNFGFDKIEVRDNGNGIKAADAPVMGVKHYTSKINSHEDLEKLETYGFRGEALGSICSVAEVQITTKTASDEFSTLYVLDSSGHIISQKPSHLGQGTTVSVVKLFKNLPVRKQYYSTAKKCKEEIKKIQDLLMAYGIIKPDLRIVFTHNKTTLWQKSKMSDHKMAFMSVLGTAIMNSMNSFQHESDDPEIFINGYLPKPDADSALTSLSSSERSFIFINRRPVHQKEILKMVRLYYSRSLNKDSSRCYPVFFMNIVLPAASLDVNLTPDKTQVMLQDKESVLLAVEHILKSIYPSPMIEETDKADANPEEIVNSDETQLKKDWSGTVNPEEQMYSTVNNGQENKKIDICLKPQIANVENVPDLDSGVVSGTSCERIETFKECTLSIVSQEENETVYGLNFAIDDSILKDTQPSHEIESPCGAEPEQELNGKTTKHLPNISDDKWSKGVALKDSRGENLKPVEILSLSPESVGEVHLSNNHDKLIKKTTNVEHRLKLVEENPKASIEEISSRAEEVWHQLSEKEKLRYEDKATKDLQRYNTQTAKATEQDIPKNVKQTEKRYKLASGNNSAQAVKLKAPLSNQQIIDKLFQSQAEKKKTAVPMKTVQIAFSLRTLTQNIVTLSEKQIPEDKTFTLIRKLNFPGAWIMGTEKKITLLNPYRVEESLLYNRLVKNHKITAEKMESPIRLTDRLLGGPQYLDTLSRMQKESPKLNGEIYFSDVRLTANGFKIKIIPENQFEIEEMSSSLPFYGIADLKEILSYVLNKNANELSECRPLKVLNYLEGEAVRLSRQLPFNLSEEDIYDTLQRMEQQIGNENKGCIHGRPFFHHLIDIPEAN